MQHQKEFTLELVGLPVIQPIGAGYIRLAVDCDGFLPLLDTLIADAGDATWRGVEGKHFVLRVYDYKTRLVTHPCAKVVGVNRSQPRQVFHIRRYVLRRLYISAVVADRRLRRITEAVTQEVVLVNEPAIHLS